MAKYSGVVKLPDKEILISSDDGLEWKLDGVLSEPQSQKLLEALGQVYPALRTNQLVILVIE